MYFLQKIHSNIFCSNNNDNNSNFENLLNYLKCRYEGYHHKNDRSITISIDEYQSILQWLIYCSINNTVMGGNNQQYETLLIELKKFILPKDINVKTSKQINELWIYPANLLLSLYTSEIDKKIYNINNSNNKHNIIKEYVNKIISGQNHKVFIDYHNQQNLIQAKEPEKIQKLAHYILNDYCFDKILSLVSNAKFKSYGNKSFIEAYNKATQKYYKTVKKDDKLAEEKQEKYFGERIKPIAQLTQFVFKFTKQYIYEALCNKYHIIPDNSFIKESIIDNQYFTGFVKNFSIMNKIKNVFKINDNDFFKLNLAKYLLLGCCNINRSKIETNTLNKNTIGNKSNNNVENEEMNNNNKKEENKKDFLKEIRSKYILKQILSYLYENNKTNI